ncbi:solute carrier family 49 member 4 [Patella vulgata]|uniref:solute carrier family 49 member 4 n=1 Tax=Patella vulgata TaxID=6465 RepID=UPI00217FF6BE|nr:solute carrier family 49 member 4 [Patella vulgata]
MSCLLFFQGPFLVPETFKRLNETDQNRSIFVNTTAEIDEVVRIERDNIIYYSYGVFAFCVLLLIAMLIYFPNKPPSPPSPSASTERLDYKSGLKQLIRNGQFWFIAIIYGLSTGTRDSWSSMIDVNFKEHNVSQVEVGWIAFTSAIAAVVATIIVARFADKFTRRLKIFLIFLFFSTTVMYLWLILTLLNVIPFHKDYLFISDVLASLLNGATSPLFYELSCEITYPVAEGVTNVVITTQNNVAALIFLGIFFIPGIGTMWMNWALLAAYGLGTVALFFLTETHHRLDVDEHKTE